MAGFGLIKGAGLGRTDTRPMKAKPNSYVIPSDIVSGMGQGNTNAGAKALDAMFKAGPYGMKLPKMRAGGGPPAAPRVKGFAAGGGVVPIVTADGEYVVDPETVAAFGGGDPREGHQRLDAMVANLRKQIVRDLTQLPGPQQA